MEKYPVKSHPETSDFQHFSKDMCRSEECRLIIIVIIIIIAFECFKLDYINLISIYFRLLREVSLNFVILFFMFSETMLC